MPRSTPRGIYDVTELSTAVKPLLLKHLLENREGVAVYLDPDIRVYGSLADLVPLASVHGIVLTPHTMVPLPRDEKRLSSADLLAAGVFNLGFIVVGQTARPFLDWWWEQTRRDALSDISRMMFTDQRWIDFGPVCSTTTSSRIRATTSPTGTCTAGS